jgi:hypothetical protein
MDILFEPIVPIAAAIAFLIGYLVFHRKRVNSILDKWAAGNEVQVIKIKSGVFRRSPFSSTFGRQEVYYLIVRDMEGEERGCWVRIGDFLSGPLFSSCVEELWEDNDKVRCLSLL